MRKSKDIWWKSQFLEEWKNPERKFIITGYEESTRSSSPGGDDDDDDNSRRPPPGAGVGSGTGLPSEKTSTTSDFRSQDPKEGTLTKRPKLDLSKHSTPRQEHISHRGAAAASQEQTSQAPSREKKHSSTPGKEEPEKQSGTSDTKDDKSKISKAVGDFPLELMDTEPIEREADDAESYDTSLPPSASQTGRPDRDLWCLCDRLRLLKSQSKSFNIAKLVNLKYLNSNVSN